MSSSKQTPAKEDPVKLSISRKRSSINTAKFRARHAANTAFMKRRINEILIQLDRPTVDFSKNKSTSHVLKGKPRPIHLPPEEERANMSPEELSQWKGEARRKRKAEQARLRRVRNDEMDKRLKAMWVSLEQEIATRSTGIRKQSSPLLELSAAAIIVDSDSVVSSLEDDEISKRSGSSQEQSTQTITSVSISPERFRAEAPLLFLASIASKHPESSEETQEKTEPMSSRPRPQPFSLDLMF